MTNKFLKHIIQKKHLENLYIVNLYNKFKKGVIHKLPIKRFSGTMKLFILSNIFNWTNSKRTKPLVVFINLYLFIFFVTESKTTSFIWFTCVQCKLSVLFVKRITPVNTDYGFVWLGLVLVFCISGTLQLKRK